MIGQTLGPYRVRAFPDTESGRWQVSSSGGRYPLWSPDGRELFYVNAASKLVAVPVDTHSGFATGVPVELFRTDSYNDSANSRPYDISRDGKRFVFPKTSGEARPTINVVTNWLQEVVAKVNAQQKATR